jgi:hypothetical protein
MRYPAVFHKEGSQVTWIQNLPLNEGMAPLIVGETGLEDAL